MYPQAVFTFCKKYMYICKVFIQYCSLFFISNSCLFVKALRTIIVKTAMAAAAAARLRAGQR